MKWNTNYTVSNNYVTYNYNTSSSSWVSTGGYVDYQDLLKKVPTAEQRRLEKLRQIQANHGKIHKFIIV